MVAVTPPDGAAWALDVEPMPGGATLLLAFPLGDRPMSLALTIERAEARTLARALLAAAGDGTERTFPRPPEPGCG